jgi:hypothetical protein
MAVVSFLIVSSCSKETSNPLTTVQPPSPPEVVPSTKSSLHGIWQNTLPNDAIAYIVYDSLTSRLAEKRDYGYNFRSELTSGAKVDSNRIWWAVGGGMYDPWYWLMWNKRRDTLTLSYDSSFNFMRFVRDSIPAHVANWIENITPVDISFYPSVTSWVQGLAYADSNWFVLTGTGGNDGVLHRVRLGDTNVTSYSFSTARAMDIAGGYLWLAGKFYIEKRGILDTTLIDRFDVSQYFTSDGWIQGITVSDNSIYLMGSREKFLVLSTNGTLQQERSSYAGLYDMTTRNGRLWGVSMSNIIHEIDPSTFKSVHSYYLAGNAIIGRFQGITIRDNKIACADYLYNSLRIYEVAIP